MAITYKDYLKKATGKQLDIYARFCIDYLFNSKDEESAIERFKQLLSWNCMTDSSYPVDTVYSDEKYESIIGKIMPIISVPVNNLFNNHCPEEEFYNKLWYSINQSEYYPSEEDKIGAVLCLKLDPRVPYFILETGLRMSDDEYRDITNDVVLQINKALFAIKSGICSQKTEIGYHILKQLQSINDEKAKVVFLANVIGSYYDDIHALIDQVSKLKASD